MSNDMRSRISSRKSATTMACSWCSEGSRRSISKTCPGCASGRPPTARTARSNTLRVFLIEEMRQLGLGDHPVGVEDAGLGVEQVDRPGVGPQLGQLTQLGQRSGGVQQCPVRAGTQRLVDDAAAEKRL